MAADNMSLGRFRLEGIPPAPRGIPQVEVTFDIDANGILNVTARDKATGREQKVTYTASTNLQKKDIERMVEEAKAHKAEDEKRKEVVEARNIADNTAYQVEKYLKDEGEKVPESYRTSLTSKIAEVRQVMAGEDVTRIRSVTDELQKQYGEMLTATAQSQQSSGSNPTGEQNPPHHPGDGDVVEGEYTETK
jgi:molecular chaperone DnaK